MRSFLSFIILAASAVPALAGWEYKVISPSDVEAMAGKGDEKKLESGLNKLGAAGWELAAVEAPGRMIFKRMTAEKVADDILEVIRLRHAKAAELAKAVAAAFPRAEGIAVVAEEITNSVLVRGKPDKLSRVRALIAELEKTAEKK